MTEPFRPADELVSAVLDGEATPDERARVEADPVLRARLEELQAASALVASPVEPQDELGRERAIRLALAEHRRPDAVAASLQRAHRRTTRGNWLTAAAVIALLVASGFLLSRLGVNGDDAGDSTAARVEGGDESGGGGEAEMSEESATDDTASAAGGEDEGQADAFAVLRLGAAD